jgi:predicted amidohydrolase
MVHNRGLAREAITDAAAKGAGLIVLPELTNSGYVFAGVDEARTLADDGAALAEWHDLAARHAVTIVGGFCELGTDGRLYNSAALIDPTGLRAVYRKAHLWHDEQNVFSAGDEDPPVVDTPAGRVGVVICYDLEFPEWIRRPALAGCEILAAPTNWPAERRPAGERAMEVVRVQADASVNRMYIAAADRCATERGVEWVGGSVIVGPDGYPLAGPVQGDRPAVILADCDVAKARDKRVGERNDVLADRRTDLYGPSPRVAR